MSVFENVEGAPDDPILGLNVAFQKDGRPTKVNLGIGAYKTAEGLPKVLNCVQKAERLILEQKLDKEYQTITGTEIFRSLATELIFGADHPVLNEKRIFTLQSVGASSALRTGAELLRTRGSTSIYVSDPTWSNHYNLCQNGGLKVDKYAYYDPCSHSIRLEALLSDLTRLAPQTPVLFHGCCHNPTGCDPSHDQWKQISKLMKEKKLLPFFDFAYQGFGEGLEEDAWAVRLFAREHPEMLLAYSFSKNLGLYGERVGLLACLTHDEKSANRVGSRVKSLVRGCYSTPPCHGARIVTTVLQDPELRKEWLTELSHMRSRVKEMRLALTDHLVAKVKSRDFSYIKDQIGMFSFSGIARETVHQLREKYAIYFPSSGRINIAGFNENNMTYVVDAIASTLD